MNWITKLIPRIPGFTTHLVCNFCLRSFWPGTPMFQVRMAQRYARSLKSGQRPATPGYACPGCAATLLGEQSPS